MAHFQSSARRSLWFGIAVAFVTDYAVAAAIAFSFTRYLAEALLWGAVCLGAVYIFQIGYALLSLARAALIFYLVEREQRVQAVLDDMTRTKMPAPGTYYESPESYLLEIGQAKDTPASARFFAGSLLGALATVRRSGQMFQTLSSLMVLEEAIRRYGRIFHSKNDPFDFDLDLEN